MIPTTSENLGLASRMADRPPGGGPAGPRVTALEAVYATAHWLLSRQRHADAAVVFRLLLRVAPRDERAWLGLGECHERAGQLQVAAELYAAGAVIAGAPGSASVLCLCAQARALARLGRARDAEAVLDAASRVASERGDDQLIALVEAEKRRLP